MPNWKKVITSGSNAHLNKITASGKISINDTNISSMGAGVTLFESINNTGAGLIISGGQSGGNTSGYINTVAHPSLRIGESGDTYLQMVTDTNKFSKKVIVSGSLEVATSTGDITASGHISSSGGNIITSGAFHNHITHIGDTDTSISFEPNGDGIYFTAGGITMMQIKEIAQDQIVFGNGTDIDYQFKTADDDNTIFIHGETDNVGIGTANPTEKLQVAGNISASGAIFLKETGSSFQAPIDGNGVIFASASKLYFQTGSTADSVVDLTSQGGGSGDMTGVDLTGVGGIEILGETNTTSGDYSATIAIDSASMGGFYSSSMNNFTTSGSIVISGDGAEPFFSASDGNLVLSGSGVAELKVEGNISASGNITASGYIFANSHITASGNISSSGTMTMLTASIGGGIFTSASLASLGQSGGGGGTTTAALTAGAGLHNGGGTFNGGTARTFSVDSASMGAFFSASMNNFTTTGTGSFNRIMVTGHISSSAGLTTTQITASGNISSSGGDIYGDRLYLDRIIEAGGLVTAGGFTTTGTGSFNRIMVAGHISSSAGMTTTQITASGQVTATGKTHKFGGPDDSELQITSSANSILTLGKDGYVGTKIQSRHNQDSFINAVNDTTDTSNLGIGTQNPTKKLQVEGDISASAGLFLKGTGAQPHLSASEGTLQLSGSGRGQLEVDYRLFDTGSTHLTTAGGGMGDIVKFGATTTAAGKVYYLKSDGTWAVTDADAGGTTSGSIAIALGSNSTNHGMLLRGIAKLSADPGGILGAPIYLSTTAGETTSTPPGSGDFARVVGFNMSGSGVIYFNPDNTTIKVA